VRAVKENMFFILASSASHKSQIGDFKLLFQSEGCGHKV